MIQKKTHQLFILFFLIDGNTYRNECEMNRMACNSRKELIAYVLYFIHIKTIPILKYFMYFMLDYSMDNVKRQMKII